MCIHSYQHNVHFNYFIFCHILHLDYNIAIAVKWASTMNILQNHLWWKDSERFGETTFSAIWDSPTLKLQISPNNKKQNNALVCKDFPLHTHLYCKQVTQK